MKILVALLVAVSSLSAADINLKWMASPSDGVTNYCVYASQTEFTASTFHTASVKMNSGTNLTYVMPGLSVGPWWFTATAQGFGIESPCSNILAVTIPEPPSNLQIDVTVTFTIPLSSSQKK